MRKITERIINNILELDNKSKKEVGDLIVSMLGGDPTVKVMSLRARRGNADGGLDGRIDILSEIEIIKKKRNGLNESIIEQKVEVNKVEAAFNVKLEKAKFTRGYLHAFKEDMIRSNIYVGIIIANKLSPDAADELERYNRGESTRDAIEIYFISLEEIIEDKITCPIILSSKTTFSENIKEYLQGSKF